MQICDSFIPAAYNKGPVVTQYIPFHVSRGVYFPSAVSCCAVVTAEEVVKVGVSSEGRVQGLLLHAMLRTIAIKSTNCSSLTVFQSTV